MSVPFKAVQPRTDLPLVDPTSGKPTLPWAQYLPLLDALVRQLAGGAVGTLTDAANDTAAAAAGVAVGSLYRSGSVVHIRVS